MAREIVVWCDVCIQEDVRTPASELSGIALKPGVKPRTIALCEEHRKELYEPFYDLVMELGQLAEGETIAGTEENKRRLRCPVPDCTSRPFKNKSSLQGHLRQQHSTTLAEATAKHGNPNGDELEADPTATLKCDVPGCDASYGPPANARPIQALAVHKARAHGIAGKKGKKKDAEQEALAV